MSTARVAPALSPIAVGARGHPAPAKINLALHVTGRRPDGYHMLSSLVAFADIGDRLTIEPAAADGFEAVGPFAGRMADSLPPGGRNIVAAALAMARKVARLHGCDIGPMRVLLDKRLPVASGIGGGSADAAALIRLVSHARPALAAPLLRAALELGADVPMCVAGRAARIGGIGEDVRPLASFPEVAAVLVNPGVPVATPLVFARLARRQNAPMPETLPLPDLGALLDLMRATRNDLEAPAAELAPAIREARQALKAEGSLFARMSGSGATVFGLFESRDAAEAAADRISALRPSWWVAPTVLGSMTAGEAR